MTLSLPAEGHVFQLNRGQFGVTPCMVKQIEPPYRLSFSWGKDWKVTFLLKELGGMTQFTVILRLGC
jgi:uncharacterized protein YndB with AHSA1/START domain